MITWDAFIIQETWQPFVSGLREDSQSAAEIMWWGNLINCSGEAAEEAHKINVKGPGNNTNKGHRLLGRC